MNQFDTRSPPGGHPIYVAIRCRSQVPSPKRLSAPLTCTEREIENALLRALTMSL